jgi:chemotaxis protein MotB
MSGIKPTTKDTREGAPPWVMTFADLMSLLMCFFVLLLSFSEMDVQKFKQIAGSMKFAFGVQRDIEVKMPPKGTSIIAQEFSPGKPTFSPIKDMRQQTTNETKDNLDFTDSLSKREKDAVREEVNRETATLMQEYAQQLSDILSEELARGMLQIETKNDEVMIRIREDGSFTSGSAALRTSFLPVLEKIGDFLQGIDGTIVVAGHTDNVPISTPQYPSNWVLSAARSATVVHHLTKTGSFNATRLQIRAHADTMPIASNNSPENRAKNRRVEIIIKRKAG